LWRYSSWKFIYEGRFMKKAFLFLALALAPAFYAAASGQESSVEMGYGFGNLMEMYSQERENSYTGLFAIHLSGYTFFNQGMVGMYSRTLFGVPLVSAARNDFADYGSQFQIGMIIGPAFRHALTENLSLMYGFGPSVLGSSFSYDRDISPSRKTHVEESNTSFGLGGDVAVRFVIDRNFFLSAGSSLELYFAQFREVTVAYAENAEGWMKGFFAFVARPYLAMGFIFSPNLLPRANYASWSGN